MLSQNNGYGETKLLKLRQQKGMHFQQVNLNYTVNVNQS